MKTTRTWRQNLCIYLGVAIGVLIMLTMLVAGRGRLFAEMIGGSYPVKSLVLDVIGLFVCAGLVVLFGSLFRSLSKKVFTPRSVLLKTLLSLTEVLVIAFAGGTFLLTTIQLYPQRIVGHDNPGQMGLVYEDVTVRADDQTLAGWFLPAAELNAPIILVTHGLNANKENFLYPVQVLNRRGFNVCIFDFRAHGHSSGRTVTMGYNESADIKAICDWISRTHPGKPVHALAYSMGGAAVIRAASQYDLFESIVLDSTFYDLVSVAKATILKPFGPLQPLFLHASRFWGFLMTGFDMADHRPGDLIPLLTNRRLFLIHGTADTIIPFEESLKLFDATGKTAELWLIKGAGHLQSISHHDYFDRVSTFFGQEQNLKL